MGVTRRGVRSLSKSGSTQLQQDITLSEGTGVTITQAGQDLEIAASSGSGDVTGPASSTDNAIARFNDTGGKTLQDSNLSISDGGGGLTTMSVVNGTDDLNINTGTGSGYLNSDLITAIDPTNTPVTNNHVVFFDGTTGKLIKDSGLTLSGTNTGDQTTISGNAGTATALETARTFRTNLASTSTASFDGTANVTPGVTGTLPVANGGTGATTLTGILKGNGTSAFTAVTAPTGTIVGTSDSQTLTNKTIAAGSNTITGLTNSNLSTTTGDLGGAWTTWSPTYTNITVGNGTATAKYMQIGKTVHYYFSLVLGSTSSVGNSSGLTFPVTASSTGHSSGDTIVGNATFRDTGSSLYYGVALYNSTTVMAVRHFTGAGTFTGSTPFTFGTGDVYSVRGTYEAA